MPKSKRKDFPWTTALHASIPRRASRKAPSSSATWRWRTLHRVVERRLARRLQRPHRGRQEHEHPGKRLRACEPGRSDRHRQQRDGGARRHRARLHHRGRLARGHGRRGHRRRARGQALPGGRRRARDRHGRHPRRHAGHRLPRPRRAPAHAGRADRTGRICARNTCTWATNWPNRACSPARPRPDRPQETRRPLPFRQAGNARTCRLADEAVVRRSLAGRRSASSWRSVCQVHQCEIVQVLGHVEAIRN